MNPLGAIVDACRGVSAECPPRDAATWAATIALAIGMAVLAAALAAERGIARAAVAEQHRTLSIVGRPPIDSEQPGDEPGPMSLADYAAWRDEPALRPLALAERTAAIVGIDGALQRLTLWRITDDLPAMLGIDAPLAGRLPVARGNAAIEVALSASVAAALFDTPGEAINRAAMIDGVPGVIVGVLPEPPGEAFAGIDAWTVFDPDELLAELFAIDPDDPFFTTPYLIGITRQAEGGGTALSEAEEPADQPIIAPLDRVVLGPRIPAALAAASGAAVLLFIASLAAGAMLLAGALLARREELALRLALGGTRPMLLLKLIAHALTICLLAAGLALLGAWWIIDAAREALLGTLPGATGLTLEALDARSALFVLLAALVTLSLTAAVIAWPVRPAWCIRGLPGVAGGIGGRGGARLNDASVVLHAALATASLGLALMLGSLAARAGAVPPGLVVERVGAMTITLPWWEIADDQERWRLLRETLEAVEATERFEAVAAADNAPIVGPDFRAIVVTPSPESVGPGKPVPSAVARLRSATPAATALLGINEVRRLTEQAASTLLRLYQTDFPPLPATISRSLAVQLFGDEDNALGQPIDLGEQRIPALVLAVVDDAADGPNAFDVGGPSIWLPMPIGWESAHWSLLVRIAPGAGELRRAQAEETLRSTVAGVMGNAAIDPVVWLDRRVIERARIYTAGALISGGAAVFAIFLALLAGIARTRLTIATRLDELRLRSAFGHPPARLAVGAALPSVFAAAIGAVLAGTMMPRLADAIAIAETASVPAVSAVWPGFVVVVGCAAACLIAARGARIDAEALFRSL